MNLTSKQKIYIIIIALMAVAIFVFALVFKEITDNRAYEKYMDIARISMDSRDYDTALSNLRKAATINDTDDSLLLMAQCYEARGDYDKAMEVLRLLDTTDSYVSGRISSLEAKRNQSDAGEQVEIAGQVYDSTLISLVLDNKGLNSSVLNQVTQLYSLNNLSLAGNSIGDVSPLTSLKGLTTLNLNGNQISDLTPLAELPQLRTLYLDNNPITDLTPLYGLSSLTTLSLKGISIPEDQLKALSAALPSCAINGATAMEVPSVIALGGTTFDPSVVELDLSYCGIWDISALSACENLTKVVLRGNSITDISPLMDIPGLTYIDISENMVSDLRPLMGLTGIRYLYASDNAISNTVPVGALSGLLELNLSNNPISNFNGIAKLKTLTNLHLSNTGFSGENLGIFQLLSRLLELDITSNDISGEEYDELQSIIPICEITADELVYTMTLGGQPITSDATEINLPNMGIDDISEIYRFPTLTRVNLAGNRISNLYAFELTDSWRTLTYLDLSSNQISDLTALAHLTNLETLNLSDNLITNFTPLYGLQNLKNLYIGGNTISPSDLDTLESWLPGCQIIAG